MGAEVSGPFPGVYDHTQVALQNQRLHTHTQVALLDLRNCTSYFTFEPDQEKHRAISENGQKVQLVLDNHFYDLTPLSRAQEPVKMESVYPQKGVSRILTCFHSVIAITGLGGHAFGSWRSRFSTECPLDRPMWLRDFLPEIFPDARIMTYGYDSSLRGSNGANITDYRRGFIQCLRNSRRRCPVSVCLTELPSNMLTISLC